MALYPECRKRAQAELDAVIGLGRLPDFSDRPSLPYLDAVLKETLRWHPVLPTALPHATIAEDVYKGYRIPAGSIVIPNIWSIMHDPRLYPEPGEFKPERFLSKNPDKDPNLTGSFGFGRRICAGRNLADSTLWLAMASLLSAFDITKPLGAQGRKLEVDQVLRLPRGGLFMPQMFSVSITPRSEEIESLIRALESY